MAQNAVRMAAPGRERNPVLVAGALIAPALLAFLMTHDSEARALGWAAIFVVTLATIARPFIGLLVFVALLYIRPEEAIPELNGMRIALIVSLATLGMLIHHNLAGRRQAVRTPLNGMILGFGLVAVLTRLPLGNMPNAAMDIGRLVILVMLVVNLVRTPRDYQTLITTLLTFTCYLAVYSIFLYYSGQAVQQDNVDRSTATGIFGDPNDLAATIVAGLALALVRIRSSRNIFRIAYVFMAGLMVWATLLTNSRGGMMALLAVFGGFFLTYTKRKALGAVLAIAVAATFLLAGPGRMTKFEDEESANLRFWAWDNGIYHMMQHPILGVGYDEFEDINEGMTAHNSFVLCFTELGLVGYFFWMGAIYYAFRRAPRPADSPPEELRDDLVGARLALAGFLVACFWLSRTYVPVLYLLIALPVAAQVAFGKDPTGYRLPTREAVKDCVRIAALSLGSIVFIYAVERHLR